MTNIIITDKLKPQNISQSTQEEIDEVEKLTQEFGKMEQVEIAIEHLINNGVYIRTVYIPPDTILTTILIKIPTSVIISGRLSILGKNHQYIDGYKVFTAEANRKLIFSTYSATAITMFFRTNATSLSDAEKEFTDDILDLKPATEPMDLEI